jgi:hypothetical protein
MNRCCLRSRILRLFTSAYVVGVPNNVGWKSRQSCWALGLIGDFISKVVGRAVRTGECGTWNALLLQFVWLSALAIGRWRLLEDVQESVGRSSDGRAAYLTLKLRIRCSV